MHHLVILNGTTCGEPEYLGFVMMGEEAFTKFQTNVHKYLSDEDADDVEFDHMGVSHSATRKIIDECIVLHELPSKEDIQEYREILGGESGGMVDLIEYFTKDHKFRDIDDRLDYHDDED